MEMERSRIKGHRRVVARGHHTTLTYEDPLQVYEAWCVCRRVEVTAPGRLVPSFRIAVAGIAAAGGAFAFEDEVDPAKFARGVTAGTTGLFINSGHDASPASVWRGGWSGGCSAVGPIDLGCSWQNSAASEGAGLRRSCS
jgi:hypothetical protein